LAVGGLGEGEEEGLGEDNNGIQLQVHYFNILVYHFNI